LPIDHPINKSYESATADLGDINLMDNNHMEAYGVEAINYNRDIENFELMKKVLFKFINDKNYMKQYKSPTDMGFNMIKSGIINDSIIRECSIKECIRRIMRYADEYTKGMTSKETVIRSLNIYDELISGKK